MAGTLSSRPNHYDALGLTPAASDEQIARAFGRKMTAFRWHPAGAAAELWIAYETLRDRIKRADYDRSLGLVPKRPQSWSMTVTQQQWTPFIASEPEMEREQAPEPHVSAGERSEAPIDARLEAIAATIRELTKPAPPELRAEASPVQMPVQPRRQPAGDLDIVIEVRRVGRMEKERLQQEDRPLNWKRPVQLVGGLVVGAGVLGALLGISARDNPAPAEAESPAPVKAVGAVPHASAVPPIASPVTVPLAAGSDAADLYPAKTRTSRQYAPKPRGAPQADSVQTSDNAPVQAQADAAPAADQVAADPLAPKPTPATLPLSNSTIARTLDRIGYRCGGVASSTALDDVGTFSVTCSSGQTYRATPVHGRYRFRRSASN